MFEHRLGLALGRTIGEIRALPYPEYRSWELFYLVEPFGFENDEYRSAALLSMLHNINRTKGKAKDVKDFMRDLQAEALKQLKEPPDISELSREELIRYIKKDFGIK
jgi:hypothetical protein